MLQHAIVLLVFILTGSCSRGKKRSTAISELEAFQVELQKKDAEGSP